jgi:hypothetical protein
LYESIQQAWLLVLLLLPEVSVMSASARFQLLACSCRGRLQQFSTAIGMLQATQRILNLSLPGTAAPTVDLRLTVLSPSLNIVNKLVFVE